MTVRSPVVLVHVARRAADGDARSLDDLLRELEPLVVRTARLIVGSGSWAAEDAAQEALLDVARGIAALREPEAAQAWAVSVATRRALKVARQGRFLSLRRAALVEEDAVGLPLDGRAAALRDAFDRLPPKLRATVVLRPYVGLSESETAEAMSCSLGTVKSNLHDSRTRLTAELVEHGFAPNVLKAVEESV
jgi:RNA polymerase sigma factor (sigma-70 family)